MAIGWALLAILFMVPMGLGIGVSARVGQFLGAGDAIGARRAASVGIAIFLACFIPLAGILQISAVRRGIIVAFMGPSAEAGVGDDTDPADDDAFGKIAYLVNRVIPLVLLDQLFDGIKEMMNGVLRGMARQGWGVATSFVAYVIVMVPACAALAFQWKQSGLPGFPGLWAGFCCGSITHAALNVCLVLSVSFRKEAERAAQSVAHSPTSISTNGAGYKPLNSGDDDHHQANRPHSTQSPAGQQRARD